MLTVHRHEPIREVGIYRQEQKDTQTLFTEKEEGQDKR